MGNMPQNISKSCSKIVSVNVFPEGGHYRKRNVYCLIDDPSNIFLASSSICDAFDTQGPEMNTYCQHVPTKSAAVFTSHLNSLHSDKPQDKSCASTGSKVGESSSCKHEIC